MLLKFIFSVFSDLPSTALVSMVGLPFLPFSSVWGPAILLLLLERMTLLGERSVQASESLFMAHNGMQIAA